MKMTFEQAVQLKTEGFTVDEIKAFMDMDFATSEVTSESMASSESESHTESQSESLASSESSEADTTIDSLKAVIAKMQEDNSSKDLSNNKKPDNDLIADWARSFM